MRFVDANVFIYAIIKPKRALSPVEDEMKKNAVEIINRINNGEQVMTSVVHLSEVVNVLENITGMDFTAKFIIDVLSKSNILVEPVNSNDYLSSASIAIDSGIGVNDALAYVLMTNKNINEIYTFDKHFETLGSKSADEKAVYRLKLM